MQRKIHLFNCDHLYELRVIEDLLNSSKPMLHDKLGFDFTVEYHYFSLNEIDELSEKVIPSLKMDFAVFVAHAQESRVSINDGRGYTKVYRALMKATGKNSNATSNTSYLQFSLNCNYTLQIFVAGFMSTKSINKRTKKGVSMALTVSR